MAGSLNKVELIGHLGDDPDVRNLPSGGKVVNISVATSESWKDRNTGEKREKTEWHRVVIFQEGLAKVAEQYLKKGSKVFLEGQLQTRKWTDQQGVDKYSTEVVLQGFNARLLLLDGRGSGDRDPNGNADRPGNREPRPRDDNAGGGMSRPQGGGYGGNQRPAFEPGSMDDDIPFAPMRD